MAPLEWAEIDAACFSRLLANLEIPILLIFCYKHQRKLLAALCALGLLPANADQSQRAKSDIALIAEGSTIVKVSPDDIEAPLFTLAPFKRAEAWSDASVVRKIAEEHLLLKKFEASSDPISLVEAEQRYLAYQQSVTRLKATLDIVERRALQRLVDDPALIKARARELYASQSDKLKAPEKVNVTTILVDTFKRDWSAAKRRADDIVRAARKASSIEQFETLAKKSTDDEAVKAGKREATAWVTRNQPDPALRPLLFEQMKIGQISKPIATQVGLMIVRVNEKVPSQPLAFEAVEQQLSEQALTEYRQIIRRDTLAKYTPTNIEFAPQWAPPSAAQASLDDRLKNIATDGLNQGKSVSEIEALVKIEREKFGALSKPAQAAAP